MKKPKLLAGLLAASLTASVMNPFAALAAPTQAAGSEITTNAIEGWPQGPEISSGAAVIMEDTTGTILYAKNKDTVLYPASITKIMTTLVALENSSLADTVTMTETGVAASAGDSVSLQSQVGKLSPWSSVCMESCWDPPTTSVPR